MIVHVVDIHRPICCLLIKVDAWCPPSFHPFWDKSSLLDDWSLGLVAEEEVVVAFEVAEGIACGYSTVLEQ